MSTVERDVCCQLSGAFVVVAGRRYTVWLWWDGSRLVGDFARPPVGVELYAHSGDTEADFDLYVSVAD